MFVSVMIDDENNSLVFFQFAHAILPKLDFFAVEDFSIQDFILSLRWKIILVNRKIVSMRFLPLFLDLSKGQVILVGSGAQAIAKLHLLRSAGANVRWFSPDFDAGEQLVLAAKDAGQIGITIGQPNLADLADALAIVSAAGPEIDERLASEARRLSLPINVVDRPDLSTFIFPAIVDRGEVVVAIGTGGASPVLARRLRERIEAILPSRVGEFADLMKRYRSRLKDARHRSSRPVVSPFLGTRHRRSDWRDISCWQDARGGSGAGRSHRPRAQ